MAISLICYRQSLVPKAHTSINVYLLGLPFLIQFLGFHLRRHFFRPSHLTFFCFNRIIFSVDYLFPLNIYTCFLSSRLICLYIVAYRHTSFF